MADDIRLYTAEEANRLIPELKRTIETLRSLRDAVVKERDLHDIEELTSHGSTGQRAADARRTMDEAQEKIRSHEKQIQKSFEFFESHQCELKSVDPGLVDFYAKRQGELVYLCWQEDEDEILFWHPIETGFAGRQLIKEDF